MPRRFTHAEAQSLIPQVGAMLRGAIDAKSEYEQAERAIQEFAERGMMMGGVTVDRQRALEARSRRDRAATSLRSAIEQVQETGCVIKDLHIGLVEFPPLFRGGQVS